MIHITILQLEPNLNVIATAAHVLPPPQHSQNHKQILSYSPNGAAAWVTFTPAWSQIPMTNLIIHLPNYLVKLGRWGVKGNTHIHTHTYQHAHIQLGLGGGCRGRQVHRECEWILTKCTELCPDLASSQLALGHDTGATLDCHPNLSTPTTPHIALQLV